MLVLENCAPFGKKCRNYASTFYFNFVQTSQMQQTSKWQTYLSYLHLETLRVHNINSLAITVVLTISIDNLFNRKAISAAALFRKTRSFTAFNPKGANLN